MTKRPREDDNDDGGKGPKVPLQSSQPFWCEWPGNPKDSPHPCDLVSIGSHPAWEPIEKYPKNFALCHCDGICEVWQLRQISVSECAQCGNETAVWLQPEHCGWDGVPHSHQDNQQNSSKLWCSQFHRAVRVYFTNFLTCWKGDLGEVGLDIRRLERSYS